MIFIKSLNKNLWPFYLTPYIDEFFTSWIYRLSIESNVKPIPFVNNCFGRETAFWNRDIDLIIPKNIIKTVLNHTPLTTERLLKMSLKSLEGYTSQEIKLNHYNTNITSLGIRHRKRKNFGLLYCPTCIKKNYFKLSWRLLTSIICLDCNEYLRDRCPSCKFPISFHRINIGLKLNFQEEMFYCSNCNLDLRKTSNKQKPLKDEINYQNFINSTIKKGYNHISNYSFTYIDILLRLSSKLKTVNTSNQFKINFENFYKIRIDKQKKMFIFLPVKTRRRTMVAVNKMLMDWPVSFLKIRELKNFNNSHLTDNLKGMPFWFYYYLIFDS